MKEYLLAVSVAAVVAVAITAGGCATTSDGIPKIPGHSTDFFRVVIENAPQEGYRPIAVGSFSCPVKMENEPGSSSWRDAEYTRLYAMGEVALEDAPILPHDDTFGRLGVNFVALERSDGYLLMLTDSPLPEYRLEYLRHIKTDNVWGAEQSETLGRNWWGTPFPGKDWYGHIYLGSTGASSFEEIMGRLQHTGWMEIKIIRFLK